MRTETLPAGLNARHHKAALTAFMVVVVAHWGEHLAQAVQVYALGWPLKEARGLLGVPFPWLISSEWMHYGYALLMLTGLIMLRSGFVGRSRTWWNRGRWHARGERARIRCDVVGARVPQGREPSREPSPCLTRARLT